MEISAREFSNERKAPRRRQESRPAAGLPVATSGRLLYGEAVSGKRYIPVLGAEDGLAASFLAALAGHDAGKIDVPHPSGPLTIEALVLGPGAIEALDSRLSEADGIIIVAGHVDAAGLESLKRLHQRLPGDTSLPQAHALHREPGHSEFKLSCPTCGQKLWVGDSQEGRPGRCPGCKQTFLIPSQARHLAASLQLEEGVPVRIHFRNDTASAVALVHELAARLIERIKGREDRQKNTTMRIVIDTDAMT